nr:vitamin K epoxide reductase family protein [uncultured Porphyromonas sp.]
MIQEALYLLRVYRSDVSSRVFRLALETSPFYPSALSLERTFSFFGLNVMVGKASANDLDRIPPYFLAFVDVNGSAETILIHRKVSGVLELYHPADRNFKDLPYDELKRVWRGYVLYIIDEPSGTIRRIGQRPLKISVLILVFLSALLVCVIEEGLILGISVIGLWLGLSLLYARSGSPPPFCKVGSRVDCREVGESRYSKILGVSLSVYATAFFVYVLVAHFLLFLGTIDPSVHYQFIGNLLLIVSPFLVGYSLFAQYKVGKICLYCLGILCVIVAMGLSQPLAYQMASTRLLITEVVGYLLSLTLVYLVDALRTSRDEVSYYKAQSYCRVRSKDYVSHFSHISCDYLDDKAERSALRLYLSPGCRACRQVIRDLREVSRLTSGQIRISIHMIGSETDDEKSLHRLLHKLIGRSESATLDIKLVSESAGISVERVPLMAVDEWILPDGTDLLSAALIVWDKDYYDIV